MYRADDVVERSLLQHERAGSGIERLAERHPVSVARVEDHGGLRTDALRDLDAGKLRELEIEDRDLRRMLADRVECGDTVRGRRDDLDAVFAEQAGERVEHRRMTICEDAGGHDAGTSSALFSSGHMWFTPAPAHDDGMPQRPTTY